MTYEERRAAIDAEICAAIAAGKTWTDYRPFLCWEERVGAMLCCSEARRKDGSFAGRQCRKESVYVSYCVGFPGRVAVCESCFQHNEEPPQ